MFAARPSSLASPRTVGSFVPGVELARVDLRPDLLADLLVRRDGRVVVDGDHVTRVPVICAMDVPRLKLAI